MPSSAAPEPSAAAVDPSPDQIRRWRRYLADEIAEGDIYRQIAARKDGAERDILLGLAEAERRHENHWRTLLGEHAEKSVRPSVHRILLRWLARIFGSVFVLALAQRAESDSPYAQDQDAAPGMAADEAIHEEVVRGLAARGREELAGNFRAAVFGANDGLVSNLALVMGIGATGVSNQVVLFTGIAGLLAGALSMGAGEFVSVRSQRELLDASSPTQITLDAARDLDLDQNELELVYLARGMDREDARHRAQERLGYFSCDCNPAFSARPDGSQGPVDRSAEHREIGNAWGAALSSFGFFSSGAIIPVLPYIFGLTGLTAVAVAALLVGLALLFTGGVVGLLSGASPLKRGVRQLLIGFGAAAVTYLLGLAFGTSVA
ncbi:VIT1/CCC1 transporter family protein [Micrococcus terreus]|uniref:VIT1/CCC1 transporter family protein n=1 Tax=Micrococcus terreus TaxID=574650 RepID=UPI0021A9116D|nr:VIT1/CCC1 transporter family protein [Micrococcus terreus]MCT2089256.1 VIT1/CCC1 transporter family protein [Micrococcus terreus]MDK7701689.1 VIT1/CCC1 transporter family protein [Micrococcus terreus]WOO97564.1 VIT1/CCC1 transporter family protein [Micrococcus terreus]